MKIERSRNERGAVMIWFALFILLMLGFIALGTDVAKLMVTRTMLQNAADAAALAGASAINSTTGVIDPDRAVARAQSTASLNKAYELNPEPVTVAVDDVEFPAQNQVKVTVHRTGDQSMVAHFFQVLGMPRMGISATATAKAETTTTAACGVIPLGVSPPDADGLFHTGQVYVLKEGGGSGTNGNYGAIDFPTCDQGECPGGPTTGASKWSCLLANGYCCDIALGQVVSTEPGVKQGPFKKAIQDRFSADTDRRPNITYDQYTGNGQRVVYVPITSSLAGAGRTTATVTGFGAFFLQQVPTSGELSGEFVYAVLPGNGGGGKPPGAIAFSVRLVH
jgi:Flp pilus assembly protein TadG